MFISRRSIDHLYNDKHCFYKPVWLLFLVILPFFFLSFFHSFFHSFIHWILMFIPSPNKQIHIIKESSASRIDNRSESTLWNRNTDYTYCVWSRGIPHSEIFHLLRSSSTWATARSQSIITSTSLAIYLFVWQYAASLLDILVSTLSLLSVFLPGLDRANGEL